MSSCGQWCCPLRLQPGALFHTKHAWVRRISHITAEGWQYPDEGGSWQQVTSKTLSACSSPNFEWLWGKKVAEKKMWAQWPGLGDLWQPTGLRFDIPANFCFSAHIFRKLFKAFKEDLMHCQKSISNAIICLLLHSSIFPFSFAHRGGGGWQVGKAARSRQEGSPWPEVNFEEGSMGPGKTHWLPAAAARGLW